MSLCPEVHFHILQLICSFCCAFIRLQGGKRLFLTLWLVKYRFCIDLTFVLKNKSNKPDLNSNQGDVWQKATKSVNGWDEFIKKHPGLSHKRAGFLPCTRPKLEQKLFWLMKLVFSTPSTFSLIILKFPEVPLFYTKSRI